MFVPEFWGTSTSPPRRYTRDSPHWLSEVYRDTALTVQLQEHPDYPGLSIPTSSTSEPSLMASMLEALELVDGHRVLELGTGTGFNAALLCARLGDSRVCSVDLDSGLVRTARERLASLGLHPRLAVGDSRNGYPPGAPYDRVIATHAVERVPYSWVEQTNPGGVILVDVRSASSAGIGHIARLEVRGDGTAVGHFRHAHSGGFMSARTRVDMPDAYFGIPARDLRDAAQRTSDIHADALVDPGFRFALWAAAPRLTISAGSALALSTPDGSWATTGSDTSEVSVAGPVDLWALVEETYGRWAAAGCPGTGDFTITITPDGQTIDMPSGRASAPVPAH
ncbi:methyltransferase domain-containing protein [Nocardiopsis dassonvillei]|uniref:methyltransferase domain-containing protein n=1 Tax=Nocardiopsis dassonvillei TaxID=2014 RepID=UPI00200E6259|nr:methyltransferase domain-containing protein [Nocardiopsis dassonvillei]MCK9870032.1 methyltransferase domain-containing protein [Nocardiopsis dassonvillei]